MKNAEVVEKPIKVEVIPATVKPGDFKKLQVEVAALEKNVSDKQKVIDKLSADLMALDARVGEIENLKP